MTIPYDPADFQRIALLMGINTIEDVVQWADSEILRLEELPDALIEVSLGKSLSKYAIQSLLCSLVVVHYDAALKRALAIMATAVRDGKVTVDVAIAKILFCLGYGEVKEDIYYLFLGLDEERYCIMEGIYGDVDISVLYQPLLDTLDSFCKSTSG